MTPAEIKSARLALGLPKSAGVRAMARLLGISERHLWKLEAGDRKVTKQTALLVESLLGHSAARRVKAPPG